MRIAVTGSHGFIGSALVPFLTTGGHRLTRLVRGTPRPGQPEVRWKFAPRDGVLPDDFDVDDDLRVAIPSPSRGDNSGNASDVKSGSKKRKSDSPRSGGT